MGWGIFVIAVVAIVLSRWRDNIAEAKAAKEKTEFGNEIKTKFSEALEEYHLKYDFNTGMVVKDTTVVFIQPKTVPPAPKELPSPPEIIGNSDMAMLSAIPVRNLGHTANARKIYVTGVSIKDTNIVGNSSSPANDNMFLPPEGVSQYSVGMSFKLNGIDN